MHRRVDHDSLEKVMAVILVAVAAFAGYIAIVGSDISNPDPLLVVVLLLLIVLVAVLCVAIICLRIYALVHTEGKK
jgi:uncharacterized membrane protein